LCAASDELAASRPAMTGEARVRLGELLLRQGRLVEATALDGLRVTLTGPWPAWSFAPELGP